MQIGKSLYLPQQWCRWWHWAALLPYSRIKRETLSLSGSRRCLTVAKQFCSTSYFRQRCFRSNLKLRLSYVNVHRDSSLLHSSCCSSLAPLHSLPSETLNTHVLPGNTLIVYLDSRNARCQMGFILNQPTSTILLSISAEDKLCTRELLGSYWCTFRTNSVREAKTPVFSLVLTANRQLYLTSRVVWNVVATTLSIS